MSLADQITLAAVAKPDRSDPIVQRRLRLLDGIDRQSSIIDKQISSDRQAKRPRGAWFWIGTDGNYFCEVRYAKKPLELAKGKTSIQAVSLNDIQNALSLVRQYVVQGEFDKQLEVLAASVRRNFKK